MDKDVKSLEFGQMAIVSTEKFNPKLSDENKICIELEHIAKATGILLGSTESKLQHSIKNVFRKGDVIFGKLRPNLRKYIFCNYDGVCSSETWVLKSQTGIDSKFLFYIVQTDKFISAASVTSGTKMPRANWDYVSKIPFLVPPLPEQKKIADVLQTWDTAIEKTDALINAKEKQFKWLLKTLMSENKRLKTEASTGNTKLPEGICHTWEKISLKDAGYYYSGLSGKSKNDFGCGKPYIPYLNIFSNSQVNTKQLGYVNVTEQEKQNRVKRGDVFFTISSETPQDVGMSSVLLDDIEECYLNSFCFGWRFTTNKIIPEFLQYYFRSNIFRNQVTKLAQGATRYNLSKTQFVKLYIYLPPLPEQKKIADILSTAQQEINLLKKLAEQYRTQKRGLMQKLLTGEWRLKST